MGQMVGADTDQLDALGAEMDRQAERLDQIRGEVGAVLGRSTWEGVDAEDFRCLWENRLSGLLLGVSEVMRDRAVVLRGNAEQQRSASEAAGGHAGGGAAQPDLRGALLDSYEDFSIPLGGLFIALEAAEELGGKGIAALSVAGPLLKYGLEGVGLGLDAAAFVTAVTTDPGSNDTWNSGADLAFSATATAVGFFCPPAGIAIAVAGLGYTIATDINPNLTKDIVTGVGNAGREVMAAVGDGAEAVGDGIEAAGAVVTNGIKGLLGL